MSNLKSILKQIPHKQKYTGAITMLCGVIGFFISMQYLHLFNTDILYTLPYIAKTAFAFFWLMFAFFGAGYIFGGIRVGVYWFLFWTALMIVAFTCGYFLRDQPQEVRRAYSPLFWVVLFGAYILYARRRSAK